jgi:hypothetical protein
MALPRVDEPVTLDKRIAGDRGFDLITCDRVEAEPELLGHLVLPLLDKVARRDDQAALLGQIWPHPPTS